MIKTRIISSNTLLGYVLAFLFLSSILLAIMLFFPTIDAPPLTSSGPFE